MPSKKKFKPFGLIFNRKGKDEKSGIFWVQPDAAEQIKNLHMDRIGEFSAYKSGYAALTAQLESGARMDSLGRFRTTAGIDKILAAINGEIHNIEADDGTDNATLTTANIAEKPVSFASFLEKAYMASEGMTPQEWNGVDATSSNFDRESEALTGTVSTTSGSATITGSGTAFDTEYEVGDPIVITGGDRLIISAIASATSMTASANAATTVSGKAHQRGAKFSDGTNDYKEPKIVLPFKNRLLFMNFLNNTSHLAITDNLADSLTITTSLADTEGIITQVRPGDGQNIRAGRTLFIPSLNEEVAAIFKDESIFILTGNSPNTFALQKISDDFGCLNNNAVTQVGADLYFIDRNNIYTLTGAFQSGTLQPKIIGSNMVRDTLKDLNDSQADKAWAVHLPDRQEVWFGIPTGSNPEVDTILVYRYPDDPTDPQQFPVWTVRKDMDTTCALRIGKKLFSGSSDGYIHKWFGTSQYAGTGIDWQYKYPFFNFGSQFQLKRIHEFKAWFLLSQDQSITIKYRWRTSDNFKISKTVTKTVENTLEDEYGTGIYNTAVYSGGRGQLAYARIPVYGWGTQIQFDISGTTPGTGPIFLGITGELEYGSSNRRYH